MELEINNIVVDLDASPLLLSYAVNELGSLETRQGSSTNDFTLLLTSKTREALGFSNNPNSVNSSNPRVKIPAKLFENRQLIDVGFIQIVEIDFKTNSAKCSFFGSNNDWFSLVKDIKLNQISLEKYNHTWTLTNIVSSFNNTEGYIYPLIDYGKFTASPYLSAKVSELYPAIFVHTLIFELFQKIGYKLAGNFINSPVYKKLLLPFSNDAEPLASLESTKLKGLYTECLGSTGFFDCIQLVSPGNIQTRLQWNDKTGLYTNWSNGGQQFAPAESGVISIDCSFRAYTSFGGETMTIRVFKTGVLQQTYSKPASNVIFGGYYAEFKFNIDNIELTSSDTIYFTIQNSASSGIEFFSIYDTFKKYININWKRVYRESQFLNLSDFLPTSLTASDLLLTLCYQFALFFQVNVFSKTVSIFQFEEVNRNKINAKDWSDKLDYSNLEFLNFTQLIQKYGQKSNFLYTESQDSALTEYKDLYSEGFGYGRLGIGNAFIPKTADVVTSKFASTLNVYSFSDTTYIPYIPLFSIDNNDNFKANLKPINRILLLAEKTDVSNFSTLSTINLVGVSGTSTLSQIPFAYFSKTILSNELDEYKDSLAFSKPLITLPNDTPLLEKNYAALGKVLNEMEYLRANFLIKTSDLNNLDFSIPIFLNIQTEKITISGYFFLNLISEFAGEGKTTTVELIQLR